MKDTLMWFVVFILTVGADYAWAKYMMYAASKQAHKAALWSSAIVICAVINVISYTENHWLAIPAVFGAYVGTYLAIWREARTIAQK